MAEENKIKNFLVNGFQALERKDGEDALIEEAYEEEVPEGSEPQPAMMNGSELMDALKDLETEVIRVRYMLEDMKDAEQTPAMPDMSAYMTTREQFKAVTAAVEKRNADTSNRTLVGAMEAISVMREDFFKLCQGMKAKIDEMSPETVLSSFEAYSVDMENILSDGGVYIGPFPYDRLNTLHQRIVDVVPTGDREKDGMVAERLSDGYKMGDKVLLKEKVTVYKFDEALCEQPEETDSAEPSVEEEPASETPSETDSETVSEPVEKDSADEAAAETNQEEEE